MLLRFAYPLAVLTAIQSGVFIATGVLEAKFRLLSTYLPEIYLDTPVTPANIAFVASALVAFFCTIKWPMFVPAFVASSVCAALALFPEVVERFESFTLAFWTINVLLSYIISQRLLHRRELWSIDWIPRMVAEVALMAGLVLTNFVLYLVYGDSVAQRIDTAIVAGVAASLLLIVAFIERKGERVAAIDALDLAETPQLRTRITQVEADYAELAANGRVVDVSELAARQSQISDLESANESLDRLREGLEKDNSAVRGRVAGLETDNARLQQRATDAEAANIRLQTEIESLKVNPSEVPHTQAEVQPPPAAPPAQEPAEATPPPAPQVPVESQPEVTVVAVPQAQRVPPGTWDIPHQTPPSQPPALGPAGPRPGAAEDVVPNLHRDPSITGLPSRGDTVVDIHPRKEGPTIVLPEKK